MAASSKTLSKEQIANLSKREKTTILIAILSLYFVVCSTMTISPALQTLYNAFPDFDRTTVMYIYTLPSLVGIPVTILIGLIAGTKVRYRTILLSATALMVVMGVAPFFIDNLYVILACRFLFGIGQASCLGVEVSLMYMFFSGKELARYMGFTQVAGSLGNIVFMQIGGILATTGWHMVFLAYLIVTVAFVLVLLFMKEPEVSAPAKKAKASEAAAGAASAKKDRIPLASWVCIFLVFFFTLVFQGLTVSLSSLVSELGIGDAATTGTLSSISMVFGMIVSAFFGPIFGVTKRFGGRVLCLFGMAAAFLIMINMRSFAGIAVSMCLFSFREGQDRRLLPDRREDCRVHCVLLHRCLARRGTRDRPVRLCPFGRPVLRRPLDGRAPLHHLRRCRNRGACNQKGQGRKGRQGRHCKRSRLASFGERDDWND